jgi:hypothetical protein
MNETLFDVTGERLIMRAPFAVYEAVYDSS